MKKEINTFEPGDLVKWIPEAAYRENSIIETEETLGIVLEQNLSSKIVKVFFMDSPVPLWCFHSHLVKVSK